MKKVELKSKKIYGLTIRTNNEKEMNPQTAQIGALWGEYFEKVLPTLPTDSRGYGVYTNYESDAFGDFDVMVGAEVENKSLTTVILEEGSYICFKAEGELPQAVIDTWREIWNYFADDNCSDKRVFKTDFELYLSESEAEIYIGIQEEEFDMITSYFKEPLDEEGFSVERINQVGAFYKAFEYLGERE